MKRNNMEWINVKKKLPSPKSHDMYWVTDGDTVSWCFFGCDDEGCEHSEWIGGDLSGSLQEKISHWMQIILPNGKKEKPSKKIESNRNG